MAQKEARLRQVLEALNRQKGVLGSTVITRDGICILNVQPRIPTPETFSAMSAALVGAAEAALLQVNAHQVEHIEVHAGEHRVIAVGASNEILLVVLAQATANSQDLLPAIRGAAQQLREALVVA